VRRQAIERAHKATRWGLVLGTLGRQGNPELAGKLEALLEAKSLEYSVVLMSEVTPESLKLMPDIEAWIQVACPRCVAFTVSERSFVDC
jgi:2-(3-amino-3-carboxypropyl)histidine synthase